MKSVMRYVSQLSKTLWDGQQLVSGIGCQPETAFDEFLSTKLLHHKDGGVMFYHMVQSFPKGADIDPCAAHEAARRLAGYFEGCEVLVCTHVDREHIHSHCIINSVNFETGKKVHMFSLLRGFCYRKMRLRDENDIPFPEYIFTKDDGTPIHPDTFSKHLKALFAEIGLPKTYHLHTLRHFFVSTLLHEGVDKNTVADLAGHGDTSFLERTYCHPQMQLKQEAAKRMSNSLFATPNLELLVS